MKKSTNFLPFSIGVVLLLVLFFSPLSAKAVVTYTRTPSDFYSGHGTNITLFSSATSTDFGTCLRVLIAPAWGHPTSPESAPMVSFYQIDYDVSLFDGNVPVPDDILVSRVSYRKYTSGGVGGCALPLVLGFTADVETAPISGSVTSVFSYVFSTFPLIVPTSSATSTLPAEIQAVFINNTQILFQGILLFMVGMFFIVWYFKRQKKLV